MMPPSIVSLDGSGNPAADGCTASYSVRSVDDDYTYYQLDATADGDWTFDHFEWTQRETVNGISEDNSRTSSSNPASDTDTLFEGHLDLGFYVFDWTIIRCVAVFKKAARQSSITVTASASPVAGGMTTPTSETRTGRVGQSETFTLVATANNGYEFKRWEDDGGSLVSKSKTTSVTKTYTENPQTFNYTAIFRKLTGLILRNDSGTILHGTGGSILRDE